MRDRRVGREPTEDVGSRAVCRQQRRADEEDNKLLGRVASHYLVGFLRTGELRQMRAHRGGRLVNDPGGALHAAGIGECNEGAQLIQIETHADSFQIMNHADE